MTAMLTGIGDRSGHSPAAGRKAMTTMSEFGFSTLTVMTNHFRLIVRLTIADADSRTDATI
ncbi:hypothetical protein LCL61_03235 [Amycolatopsis coloradensis]|uniref:Uncharacterized protein n=1 Tax=Amycolatopsis coloradensis TaxID=76021 RepID=A0ACD5B5H6_9PSEU